MQITLHNRERDIWRERQREQIEGGEGDIKIQQYEKEQQIIPSNRSPQLNPRISEMKLVEPNTENPQNLKNPQMILRERERAGILFERQRRFEREGVWSEREAG